MKFTSDKDKNIYAEVIEHSVNNTGVELVTLELQYPRSAHCEIMTHRVFSRNAQSNRAIKSDKLIENIYSDPYVPIHWGKEQKGMQAYEESNNPVDLNGLEISPETMWRILAKDTCTGASFFHKAGYHKQVVNRLLEPFQYIKVLISSTEWDNFFCLKLAEDAYPEIKEIANLMYQSIQESDPTLLEKGQWHLPYITEKEKDKLNHKLLILCSVTRCAKISYLNHGYKESNDYAGELRFYDRLVKNKHLSPTEHQAKLIDNYLEEGITAYDYKKGYMSNNFRGFIQYRALIEKQLEEQENE